MKPIGVFYATREGQTRRVAEHISSYLRSQHLEVDLKDIRRPGGDIALTNYSAALLAASVHIGRHEREMVKFVKEHSSRLRTLPAAFVSVNLTEAAAERSNATPEERAKFSATVEEVLDKFFTETHWHPEQVKPVAGALRYSKYDPFKRYVMKNIARSIGAETDTSKDYEYTDWAALDQFVEQFTSKLTAS